MALKTLTLTLTQYRLSWSVRKYQNISTRCWYLPKTFVIDEMRRIFKNLWLNSLIIWHEKPNVWIDLFLNIIQKVFILFQYSQIIDWCCYVNTLCHSMTVVLLWRQTTVKSLLWTVFCWTNTLNLSLCAFLWSFDIQYEVDKSQKIVLMEDIMNFLRVQTYC